MMPSKDPFANVTVFPLGAPNFDAGRYPQDDFDLRAGRDSIPNVPSFDDPPDVFSGGGLPSGGTANQVLTKIDGTDYNADWEDPTGSGAARVFTQALTVAGTVPTGAEIDTALAAVAYTDGAPLDHDLVILTVSGTPKLAFSVRLAGVTESGLFARVFTVSAVNYGAIGWQLGLY